jgi:hypothetical protein
VPISIAKMKGPFALLILTVGGRIFTIHKVLLKIKI